MEIAFQIHKPGIAKIVTILRIALVSHQIGTKAR